MLTVKTMIKLHRLLDAYVIMQDAPKHSVKLDYFAQRTRR